MIDIAALDIDQLEQLRNEVNRRILEMRQTRGLTLPDLLRLLEEVKTALHDQGKEWHSLERWQWMDGVVRFWLNPKDQELYNSGWFTIDDLIAWGREVGPVVVEFEDEQAEDADGGPWQDADGIAITWLPKSQTDEDTEEEESFERQS